MCNNIAKKILLVACFAHATSISAIEVPTNIALPAAAWTLGTYGVFQLLNRTLKDKNEPKSIGAFLPVTCAGGLTYAGLYYGKSHIPAEIYKATQNPLGMYALLASTGFVCDAFCEKFVFEKSKKSKWYTSAFAHALVQPALGLAALYILHMTNNVHSE